MGHSLKPDEPLHETAAVLSYETGMVLQYAMYLHWSRNSPDEKGRKAILGSLKSELMDVGAQFSFICEQVGVDPTYWITQGIEKAKERFSRKEFRFFELEREGELGGRNGD